MAPVGKPRSYMFQSIQSWSVFVFAKSSLSGAEYGMRLCVLVQGAGDEVSKACKHSRTARLFLTRPLAHYTPFLSP